MLLQFLMSAVTLIPLPQTIPTDGFLWDKDVILGLPISGNTAWTNLLNTAATSITISNINILGVENDTDDTVIFARAIVYVAKPIAYPNYDQDVEDAWARIKETYNDGQAAGDQDPSNGKRASRSLMSYVVAYDFVYRQGSSSITQAEYSTFQGDCDSILYFQYWERNEQNPSVPTSLRQSSPSRLT